MTLLQPGGRTSTRRKWAAIGLSTLLLTGSFWAVLLGFQAWLGDLTSEDLEAGAEAPLTTGVVLALVGGFVLMVAGFAALAYISRRPRPLAMTALASALGAGMWLWLPFLVGEPVTPMVAGFAAGGVAALRTEPEHTMGRRVLAAVLITAYVFLLLRLTPLVGAIVTPLLPLPALAWADAIAERRAASRPVGEDRPPGGRPRSR
jgi:FtsH-binding integral membrane protein